MFHKLYQKGFIQKTFSCILYLISVIPFSSFLVTTDIFRLNLSSLVCLHFSVSRSTPTSTLLQSFLNSFYEMGIFTLVGDSNVRRHMSPLSCRDAHMSTAEVNICGRIEAFREVLRSTRVETVTIIVACVTNFVTASDDSASSSVSLRVRPVLQEFREVLLDFCQEQPER